MAADTQLRRRVTRLENETESIYELITEIKSTLDDHTQRLDGVDQRFDGVDESLRETHRQLQVIETTLTEVVRRLPEPS